MLWSPMGMLRGAVMAGVALALVAGAVASAPVALADSHEEREPGPVEGPMPVLFGDVNTLDDFFAALTEAGFGPLALQEIGVVQPWIPVASAGILILDGAQVEVYQLSASEATTAIGNLTGEGAAFQPPANVTIWQGLEFVLILRDAPNQFAVQELITSIVGPIALATIAGLPPPPPDAGADGDDAVQPEVVADPPAALPTTGSGGIVGTDSNGVSVWWITAGAGLAVAVALGAVGLRTGRFRRTQR